MIPAQVMAVHSALVSIGIQPPGVGDKMTTIAGWFSWAASWGGAVAFVAVGGTFMWAHYGGHGSQKAVSALFYTMIGCAIIAAAGVLSQALLG